jgi:hypothetical protein
MISDIQTFIENYKKTLMDMINGYLSGTVTHERIRNYVWDIIDDWLSKKNKLKSEPVAPGEREFWAAVWMIQHIADQEHWEEGLPQKYFPELLTYLNGHQEMPDTYSGGRP